MDLTQLLQHFDSLAETPDAVKKLRKLILDFAIRGGLLPQNPTDDPASHLVERAKAVPAKNRKKLHAQSNGEQVVPPFSLPENWCWTRLEELGDTAPRNELSDKIEVGFSPMRLVTAKFGEPLSFERKSWSEVRKGFTHFAEGDVVVAKITPCFENGKSGVIRGAPNGFGAGTTELHVFRPVAVCVLPEYVLIFLKSSHFLANGEKNMTGSAGQKRVPWNYFARTPFPLPPLPEQHRIVAKVEQLMALCDELEARQTTAREHRAHLTRSAYFQLTDSPLTPHHSSFRAKVSFILHNSSLILDDVLSLRQAILSLAVQGHLLAQRAEDEPVFELLERIRRERKQIIGEEKAAKSTSTSPVEESDHPFRIPPTWQWVRLPDVCHVITDGEHLMPEYADSGVPLLSAKHLGAKSLIFEDFKYVSQATAERCWSRCFPQERDILVVSRGGGVGRTIISGRRNYCLMGSVLLFKPATLIDERFLCCFLNSTVGNEMLKSTSGASAQQAIYIAHLKRDYLVPLPPLAEQQRIVAKVGELTRWCDALEARLAESQTTATHLLDATLHQILAT